MVNSLFSDIDEQSWYEDTTTMNRLYGIPSILDCETKRDVIDYTMQYMCIHQYIKGFFEIIKDFENSEISQRLVLINFKIFENYIKPIYNKNICKAEEIYIHDNRSYGYAGYRITPANNSHITPLNVLITAEDAYICLYIGRDTFNIYHNVKMIIYNTEKCKKLDYMYHIYTGPDNFLRLIYKSSDIDYLIYEMKMIEDKNYLIDFNTLSKSSDLIVELNKILTYSDSLHKCEIISKFLNKIKNKKEKIKTLVQLLLICPNIWFTNYKVNTLIEYNHYDILSIYTRNLTSDNFIYNFCKLLNGLDLYLPEVIENLNYYISLKNKKKHGIL